MKPPAKSSRSTEPKRDPWRPTKYHPKFIDALIVASKQKNNTITMFAASIDVARSTLYVWADKHPDFSDAMKMAMTYQQAFFEAVGLQGIQGRLRRVSSETPVLDQNGKPVMDPNTGEVLKKVEYAPATFAQGAWCFWMKAQFGWREEGNQADEELEELEFV